MDDFNEKTLTTQSIYEGKVFNVIKDDVKLSNGGKSIREVVLHPGGVVIVAVKEYEDEKTLLLVKQYRYPIKQASLELPAGKLDYGENPNKAAKRELEEETGYTAKKWQSLGFVYTTPGFCDEKLYLYLATDLEFIKQNPDEDEIIECFEYNLDNVFEMIKKGEINDAKTICAIARAFGKI